MNDDDNKQVFFTLNAIIKATNYFVKIIAVANFPPATALLA